MPDGATIREASLADIPEILRQRRAMYEDMNYKEPTSLEAMAKLTADYLAKAMAEGSFRAWLACEGDHAVAGGAVIISPWPAHPYDLECRRATILNVYTDPAHRRRGLARQLMQTMISLVQTRRLRPRDLACQRRRPPSLRVVRIRSQQRNAAQAAINPACGKPAA